MSRTTVIRYLRTTAFPERAQSRRVSVLDPYMAYLDKRWEAGCHNGINSGVNSGSKLSQHAPHGLQLGGAAPRTLARPAIG